MGYTHSWDRPQVIEPETFQNITVDFTRLLPALERAGAPLANPHGIEEPEITAEFIGFNGLRFCGHSPNPKVRLPWPSKQGRGIGNNEGIASGTLPHRCCSGDCSYESLWFERRMAAAPSDPDDSFSCSCKTAFRPYDLAVTAFLLIARHHLGSAMVVTSDGEAPQWDEARVLCQWELGYGLRYQIGTDGKLIHSGRIPASLFTGDQPCK